MKKEKGRKCIRRVVLTLAPVAVCAVILAMVIPGMLKKKDTGVVYAKDLMNGIVAMKIAEVDGKKPDAYFKEKYMEFALSLFKETLSENNGDSSVMVSPLSVYYAFAMAGNGAEGSTKEEIESVLGLEISELNKYLLAYADMLESTEEAKFSVANSIWFRNDSRLKVEGDFLQTNANYYGAEIYKANFDDNTVKDINGWVDKNTYGMIDKIVDRIKEEELMYLINAVAFEGEWKFPYTERQIKDGTFTNAKGENEYAKYLYTSLDKYIKDDNALGFIKEYKGDYAFVALLPNEGMTVEEYLATLTSEGWIELVENKYPAAVVRTRLPKFKSENTFDIGKVLEKMGMTEVFDADRADFSKMGTYGGEKLYVSGAVQKTYIEVDEKGTKAAAVTGITKAATSAAPQYDEIVEIYLERPFVYAIIDTNTNLPIFIGTVMSVE